jgi:hypothetical protein
MAGRDARIPRVERRTFLVLGAAAVGLTGCTSDPSNPGPPSPPAASAAPSDPDARLRDEVAASEVSLLTAYRSAIRANPDLAVDLAPFVAQHEAHLDRVAPAGSAPPLVPATPSDSVRPSTQETAPLPAEEVLAALAAAESAAQAQRATACDGAQDPGLARDLCLIAASEAQHAVALEGLAAGEPAK